MANVDWFDVPLSRLDDMNVRKQWDAMKAAYRTYQEHKAQFEQAFSAINGKSLPTDQELKFGYNFGKLSIAVGPKRERKQAKAETQSLGDWLASRAAGGHNS